MKSLLLAALLAATCQHGNPTGTGSPPPPDPVSDFPPDGGDSSAPIPAPSSVPMPAPDTTALQLCLDNFQALNPDVPREQLQELFCTGDQLLAWHRQALVKGKP